MRLSVAALLLASVPAVLGQNASILTDLLSTLNDAGLTQLVSVASQINSSAAGPSVLAQLASGKPYVLFAPDNSACKSSAICCLGTSYSPVV